MINARQFAKHERALAHARDQGLVLVGGTTDDSSGWFVEPTILESATRTRRSLTEELFAPILTTYVYDDADWDKTLRLVDESTPYGLAGAGFASDERALAQADDVLRYAAGNYYVNDKPGRAAVGQGVVEERLEDGLQFGEARLRELVEQTTADQLSVAETVRSRTP